MINIIIDTEVEVFTNLEKDKSLTIKDIVDKPSDALVLEAFTTRSFRIKEIIDIYMPWEIIRTSYGFVGRGYWLDDPESIIVLTLDFPSVTSSDIKKITYAVKEQHPEVFLL